MKKILFLLLFPYSLWAQSKITVTAGRGTEVDPVAAAVVGILKSNGTAISAATANTDYTTPTGTVTLTNKTLGASTTVSESISFSENAKQTFNPGGTVAGINVGSHTADPSTPANGDVFYESTLNELRARINGAWVALGAGGGVSDGDKGNITVSGTGATWTIDNDVVTYAKMQDVSATSRFLGRITASAGDAEELTGTQATTLLDVFTTSLKGLVPAASGGSTTTQFLRKDGTWQVPAAGNVPTDNGTANEILQTNGSNVYTWVPHTTFLGFAVSDETTDITTGTGKLTFRMPYAMTLTEIRASVNTASSSGVITVNIKENGTTIFSTQLTIDAGEKTSTTAATVFTFSDSIMGDDSEITVDIVGAGTGAKGLKVTMIGFL